MLAKWFPSKPLILIAYKNAVKLQAQTYSTLTTQFSIVILFHYAAQFTDILLSLSSLPAKLLICEPPFHFKPSSLALPPPLSLLSRFIPRITLYYHTAPSIPAQFFLIVFCSFSTLLFLLANLSYFYALAVLARSVPSLKLSGSASPKPSSWFISVQRTQPPWPLEKNAFSKKS